MINIARLLKGDKAGVVLVLVGTIAQSVHTYFIVHYSSRLPFPYNEIQAILLACFFSFSLMIYTFRAGSLNMSIPESQSKKITYMK